MLHVSVIRVGDETKQFKTHYFVIILPITWFTAGANCHKSSLQFQNPHEITNCVLELYCNHDVRVYVTSYDVNKHVHVYVTSYDVIILYVRVSLSQNSQENGLINILGKTRKIS